MKYVYSFLPGRADGDGVSARVVGNKGAQLAAMSRMGLPVPPGFTISTEVCGVLRRTGGLPASLRAEVGEALGELGRELGLRFGDGERPLLVSVRSGAPVSMPGMMPTVSNVGLTRATLPGLIAGTNDPRFAYDTFRRLIETYAKAVMEPATQAGGAASVSAALAEQLDSTLGACGEDENGLSAAQLARLCEEYLLIVEKVARRPFPESAEEQLRESVNAVFRSWDNRHAAAYRERAGIPHEPGTAVTVQAMVFGNLGDGSGAGVLFSRDPVTGARGVAGEWLPNAQGEDVVGGGVTPYSLSAAARGRGGEDGRTLEESLPAAFDRLKGLAALLEARHREAQEIEFVIQEGRVWLLQTRGWKSGRLALARAAVEMAREGLITVGEALERTGGLSPDEVCSELEPSAKSAGTLIARGLPASVGAAAGVLALTADRAERLAGEGKDVIFAADTVAPEDIHGIDAAAGLLTNVGGVASHLAVTARGWDKVCVVGCGTLEVDAAGGTLRAAGVELKEGDEVTVDGNDGAVYAGRLALRKGGGEFEDYFSTIRAWRRAGGVG